MRIFNFNFALIHDLNKELIHFSWNSRGERKFRLNIYIYIWVVVKTKSKRKIDWKIGGKKREEGGDRWVRSSPFPSLGRLAARPPQGFT